MTDLSRLRSGPAAQVYSDIYNLLCRYCWAFDTFDMAAMSAAFAPDAILDNNRDKPYEGREAIVGYFDNLIRQPVYRTRRHQFDNLVIDETESGYRGKSYWTVTSWNIETEAKHVEVLGLYDDTYVSIDGVWCFQRRKIRHWSHIAERNIPF